MSTAVAAADPKPREVRLTDVEAELAVQLQAAKSTGNSPVHMARMSNLVVFCDRPDQVSAIEASLPEIAAIHPARIFLLIAEAGESERDIMGEIKVSCLDEGKQRICIEQVILRASGNGINRLPFAVRSLLIGDLPTNLWWASRLPPPLAAAMLYDLTDTTEQIIYDSLGWAEPQRGASAAAAWLAKFERGSSQRRWRIASDLNWRRLKPWRRILTQALDPATAPGAIASITEVSIEHGPHAVTQAWLLLSWLAARLKWRVQAGKLLPGVEISWDAWHAAGVVRMKVRRLPEGPPEVRNVRIACTICGQQAALNFFIEEGKRLAVKPENADVATRTITLQPQSTAEMVARQLSDRERDRIFGETMAVAQIFAQSVQSSTSSAMAP